MNGCIAGRHWMQLTESMFGYVDEYLGSVLKLASAPVMV